METPQIQKTRDYDIFKSVSFNREKNKRHIESIKKIILKENLLHLHPILVNEKMEVVDGQHRLEAAKDLGLEIFYIQDKISYEHILNSNLFQKKLVLEDVVKFYALKDAIPSYIEFMEILGKTGLSPKSVIGLIFGVVSPPIMEFIKSGLFMMPNDKQQIEKIIYSYCKFKEFAVEKRVTPISMLTASSFTIAFRNLVLLAEYNETVFINKLAMRWFDLKPQINSKEWARLLISIYNWKNHNPITNPDGT